MNQHIYVLILLVVVFLSSCKTEKDVITKPAIFEFGSSMDEMRKRMVKLSDSVDIRLNEAIQLPTAKNTQSQLNVYGFTYAGQKRNVELIFADDKLDIVWILTTAEEEQTFIDHFTSIYGEPTHITDDATFFLNDATAVRTKPHEILFMSKRLKVPYQKFLQTDNK